MVSSGASGKRFFIAIALLCALPFKWLGMSLYTWHLSEQLVLMYKKAGF